MQEKEGAMSSKSTGKKYLLIPLWVLILAIVAFGMVKSGHPANLVDPSAFLFVLVGGIALVMISFPGAEIRRALRDAVASPGDEVNIRNSAHFWEAAGRGFWIVGVLRSILNFVVFFNSLKTRPIVSPQLINMELAEYLLATLYGILLAVICFIPCWKLMGRVQNRTLATAAEQEPMSTGHSGRRFGVALGYVLFLLLWVWAFPYSTGILMAIAPAVLLVLGGTIAMMLFMRDSGPTLSTAFAAMGLIGSLLGIIQMLFGLTEGVEGIGHVALALAFFIASCLTALLGMVLVSAPLEDRSIRTELVTSPSAFSRAAWYVFPLLVLITLIPMAFELLRPLIGAP
jgi:flagellar motor component MotA